MQLISGGVCAAKGFKAAGIHCGIRKNRTKKDLALLVSDVPASAAALYTTNLVKGAPLTVTKEHIADGIAQAVICNSGNANTCNADGIEIAEKMSDLTAEALGIRASDIVVASTGVIGQPLCIDPIAAALPALAENHNYEGSPDAAEAIMTTDTIDKQVAVEFTLGGKVCRLGGIAKGSGMIHPNMATMLVFLTTDAAIDSKLLHKALHSDISDTFNMLSIDGDTSTNDMGDGEGATKLLECLVSGAKEKQIAKTVAKSVICSSLLKAAMFGSDANWGRVLCAIGYSGAQVDVNKIDVAFRSAKGTIEVCKDGAGIDFSEEIAKEILLEKEIEILVNLNDGDANACAWGCDLTYDYVKINGDYRT